MGPVGSPRPAPRGAPASSPTGPCRHPATTRPPVHTTLLPVGLAARPPPLGQLSSPLLWSRLAGGGQQGGRRQVCRAHGWLSVTLPPPSPAPFLQGMGSRIPSQLRRGGEHLPLTARSRSSSQVAHFGQSPPPRRPEPPTPNPRSSEARAAKEARAVGTGPAWGPRSGVWGLLSVATSKLNPQQGEGRWRDTGHGPRWPGSPRTLG